jgi:outer membrane PBP1 activator LpoA protein
MKRKSDCIRVLAAQRTTLRAALLYGALCVLASILANNPARAQMPFGVDAPHIALLLPIDSSVYRRHAEALRDGFLAASKSRAQQKLPIRVYAVGDDSKQAVMHYQQALQTGARLVVGPMLRGPVTAVAASDVAVPTLVLNMPEGNVPNRANLYVLSLQIENEARQAARLAWRDGRRNAYTVHGDTPLLKRVHLSFVDEFTKLGGKHVAEFAHNTSPAELARLRQAAELKVADMVFLALDARRARTVRAYLDSLAIYATSQIYTADRSPAAALELAGIRFVDMPWLVQHDHPAVVIYPRQDFGGDADLERLYALGIDAWRISEALLARQGDIVIDGVTGKLTLGRDRFFSRELTSARIADGPAPLFGPPTGTPAPVTPAAPVPPAPPARSPLK